MNLSGTLIGSLTRESNNLRYRAIKLLSNINLSSDKTLLSRLRSELNKLNQNRLKILNISENMFRKNYNELSFEFLLEITKRSNTFQQI